MKSYLTLILLFLSIITAQAQSGAVKGRIISSSGVPQGDVEIRVPDLKILKYTEGNGEFSFSNLPYGSYSVLIGDGIRISESIIIKVDQDTKDVGDVTVNVVGTADNSSSDQLPVIGLEDGLGSGEDDGADNQNFSAVLSAYRDPFLSAAAFTFGPLRYQLRGYKRNELEVYMNHIPMNDVEAGAAFWGQWGGLNDVFRNQYTTFALNPMEVGFGGLQGGTAIDASAANQRKQTRITYSLSNRSYRHRIMATHNTGLMSNGFAISVSVSKRWATEGYIPGTFYDGYSYYLGLSKQFNPKFSMHFITFGSPTKRGKAGPATQEAMDLAGTNYYNPNWGMQDGEKRNSKINNTFQPVGILSFEYNPNPLENLTTSIAYQDGFNGNSALDWYNANDPRPDYYKKLPSSYIYDPSGSRPDIAEAVKNQIMDNPDLLQVDWAKIYESNRTNIETVNGVTGRRSKYVIGDDRDDVRKISIASNYRRVINDNLKVYTGLSYQLQMMHSYRKMLDLLGGDYFVNLNQFAERTYVGNFDLNQNDVNNPNQIVKEGDIYNYNYESNFQRLNWWGQANYTTNRFDFFLTGRVSHDKFNRNGLFKNGIFESDSYGKSDNKSFLTFGAKAGVTYKIDGRNYLYLNGNYSTNAPTFDNTFVSPRVRNLTIDNPKVETVKSLEGGYLLHTPYLNGRLSGFVTDFDNITDIKRFYHEEYRTFVNYVMTDISIRNLGAELALQTKISPSLSATAVATWTQVFYTSRPNISVYRDNDTNSTISQDVAYMKNYFVASGPQSAYTLGLNYRSPQYWYANINFNYMDRNFIDVNPTRLTERAVELMDRNSDAFKNIVKQEQFPSFYTIDLFAGKSFALYKTFKSLPRTTFMYINVGVNNITNNKNIITGGFNQLRYDLTTRNPDRFPPKYFYGLGINYFVNVSFKI